MKIKKLADDYCEAEKKLLKAIHDLGNDECSCDNPDTIQTIHEGEEDEIVCYCINCGGAVV